MIEISEEKPIDVTTELYPAIEPGQDAVRRAVVAVDSAGARGERAVRGDCSGRENGLVIGCWSLVIGYLASALARLPLEMTNDQ